MVPVRLSVGSVKQSRRKEHTRLRSEGVGRTEHGTASFDGVETLDDECNYGSRGHVLDESWEEGLVLEIGVVWRWWVAPAGGSACGQSMRR